MLTVRPLSKISVRRFIDHLTIPCPTCRNFLRLNPTDDNFLFCWWCNCLWDLEPEKRAREAHAARQQVERTVSHIRPDGSMSRRKVAIHGQLDFEGNVI